MLGMPHRVRAEENFLTLPPGGGAGVAGQVVELDSRKMASPIGGSIYSFLIIVPCIHIRLL